MSYLVSSACVYLRCPGVAKSVLMQLADIANDHGTAWPSIEHLCMRTDWSRRAVIDALDWLEEQGAIVREKRSGRHTSYRITPSNFKGERHPVPGQPELSDPCTTRTRAAGAPVQEAHPTRAAGARDPCTRRTLTTKNHQEPSIPPNPPAGGEPVHGNPNPEQPAPRQAGDGFAEFFAGFPRRVDETGAQRAWRRLAPDEALQQQIAQAVAAWRQSDEWRREDGRYIPKPGNWLRGRRWLDVPGLADVAAPPAVVELPVPVRRTPEELAANAARAREVMAHLRAAGIGRAGHGAN